MDNDTKTEITKISTPISELPENISEYLNLVISEHVPDKFMIKMKTFNENNTEGPFILALSGTNNMMSTLELLCENLKTHVTCLQYYLGTETITQSAMSLLPVSSIEFESACNNWYFLVRSKCYHNNIGILLWLCSLSGIVTVDWI